MDNAVFNDVLAIMKKVDTNAAGFVLLRVDNFGRRGKIKLVIYPDTIRKLTFAVRLLTERNISFVVLGKGSNTLASDEYYDGVVVSALKLDKIKIRGQTVTAQAGASAVALGKSLRERGLTGGEFFACLPASVGGAVVMNAGCFGQDVKSVVTSVTVLHRGKSCTLSADKCRFGKRNSVFKNNPDYVVLSAAFKFKSSTSAAVEARIADMRRKKAESQPLNYRSAGCALYHDKAAVSRLTDEAGLKGFCIGGAQVSEKHAGFVVNVDKAKSKDIYLVVLHVKNALEQKYGVIAKTELSLINFTKDEQDDLFAGS